MQKNMNLDLLGLLDLLESFLHWAGKKANEEKMWSRLSLPERITGQAVRLGN